jgi:hypothetical protein
VTLGSRHAERTLDPSGRLGPRRRGEPCGPGAPGENDNGYNPSGNTNWEDAFRVARYINAAKAQGSQILTRGDRPRARIAR